ncbi:MAG TPA: hypothetical protein VEA69_08975 [Tepidisphaeraceae bacterium]|nr:hypothetical protein [Tepidisphaeraceae bacterium]
MAHDLFNLSEHITAIPVVHGSGDFAVEVRRVMLAEKFDCLAVPLPPGFKRPVEEAIGALPVVTVVAQNEAGGLGEGEGQPAVNYVPVDPCQPVIAAIRVAMGERMPRAYVDLEVESFEPYGYPFPDPYALKTLPLEKFVAATLPAIPRPTGQPAARVVRMAQRLAALESKYARVLFVCSLLEWPWVREAYNAIRENSCTEVPPPAAELEDAEVEAPEVYQPDEKHLYFCTGELPFITGLYEQARAELDDDENLSIDGIKDLLIVARDRYKEDLKKQARPITPKTLGLMLKYVRNLSLVERRLTPDLYTLVTAAQQVAGDEYALQVVEVAKSYPYNGKTEYRRVAMGIDQVRLPDGEIATAKNRFAGPPLTWRSLELRRRPDRQQQKLWQMRWNPFRQCSWPPEDVAIERFRTHTFEKAKQIIGQDLARVEKFTTSVQDGIDIRETLRNWHTGDLYVRIFPPNRGSVDAVVMLFDSPADPREYSYRVTWMHEHEEESTLAFFATDWRRHVIGPGIAQAVYGGALFIFPPIPGGIGDIWREPFFDKADTMEERLLMAACFYTRERHVALMSAGPPGAAWRKIAKQFGKKLVHMPLNHFSATTIQQLRVVHVLNGGQVRSYAAEFIRKG